ncbi:MAG: hypothetical protein ACR2O2_13055 [Ruegeria sp.]
MLAVIVAATVSKPIVAIAFVAGFFLIGLIEEVQGLMLVDFLSDHLTSKSRMSRLTAVVIGAALAAIAHSHEVIWAVVFVTFVSGLAAIACARLATYQPSSGQAQQG